MTTTFGLVRVPLDRLRLRRGWLPAAGWSLFAVVVALSARSIGAGADRVLRGSFSLVVLPLLTYGLVSATLGGTGLGPSLRGVVALGASPRRAAFASIAVALTVAAVASGFVAAVVCALAHGPSDPPLALDLPASFGVGLLGGSAYAAYFCAGSAIRGGGARAVFLGADYVVGTTAGMGAILTPRAHVLSLLGGPLGFDLSRRTSSVVLALLVLAYAFVALRLSGGAGRWRRTSSRSVV